MLNTRKRQVLSRLWSQNCLARSHHRKTGKNSKGLAIWLAVIGLVLIGAILLFGAPSDDPEISKSTQQNATPIESQTGAVPVQKRADKATQMKFKRVKSHDFGIPIRSPSGGSNKVGFSIDVPAHWKPDSILEEEATLCSLWELQIHQKRCSSWG